MLFLSQPFGVGFSYGSEEPGTLNNFTGDFQDASIGGVNGGELALYRIPTDAQMYNW